MDYRRWMRLTRTEDPLTEAEIADGWHFCLEFDGLLIGPGFGELQFCKCIPQDHPARKAQLKDWL